MTEETVAAFITQAGCGPVLAYIADLLDERLRARVTGERVDGATLVLPVQSTDEAALWIGALQRTCAPATARLLGYTTFARAAAPLEVDALASSGLDLVCVPASDRLDVVDQHPDTALVTAQAAAAHTLTTAWGVLVAAMSRDLGTWQGARSAMRDLLSFLTVHTDLSPAWPLAMVEASDAGILGVSDGHLDTTVDLELVACQPSGLAGAAYLSSLVAERILGASQSDPAHWWDKLSVVPRDVPATGVVAGLAEKYLNSAVQDAAWLLRRERHDDEDAERSLAQWSTSSQGCAVLPDLAGRLIATLEAAGAAGARERLAAVGNLVRDGVVLDETVEMRLLAPVAQAFMTADGSALAEPSLPSALRAGVCRLLGDLLVGEYRFHTVPSLAPQVCDWLARWRRRRPTWPWRSLPAGCSSPPPHSGRPSSGARRWTPSSALSVATRSPPPHSCRTRSRAMWRRRPCRPGSSCGRAGARRQQPARSTTPVRRARPRWLSRCSWPRTTHRASPWAPPTPTSRRRRRRRLWPGSIPSRFSALLPPPRWAGLAPRCLPRTLWPGPRSRSCSAGQ